jgi:c(7)-type cytochrome triheme protein
MAVVHHPEGALRMRRMLAVVAVLAAAWAHADDVGGRKRRTPPQEYGRVVIANHSARAKMAPVVFDHWLHRAKYTCRVCHVDVGFAMKGGATDIQAADNAKGMYCGACHNDRTKSAEGNRIFAACTVPSNPALPTCVRCHSSGVAGARRDYEFSSFTKDLPRGRFGNGIDWEKAEESGLIKPVDFVEGLSFKRAAIAAQKDFALAPKLPGMPDIIFSHTKHTFWSGCEGCHPDLFLGVKRGLTKYTMADIFEGNRCGACHLAVAFPVTDCQRCHSKPVQ